METPAHYSSRTLRQAAGGICQDSFRKHRLRNVAGIRDAGVKIPGVRGILYPANDRRVKQYISFVSASKKKP